MKLFIGSDTHGSAANTRRFLQDVGEAKKSDEEVRAILLGDIYNHGPRNPFPEEYAPMTVAKMLNEAKEYLTVIHGNCDSEVDQMISEFEILPDYKMECGERTLYFTHGHKCNADLPYKEGKSGDFVFFGHFHRQIVKVVDGITYVCVGALGLSPDGVERSYAIVDDTGVKIVSLETKKVLQEVNF